METKLSKRLAEIIDALPLAKGMRVLEIGCGPGAAARAIAARIGNGHVLAIDRSEKAIQHAINHSLPLITTGQLSFRKIAIEYFELNSNEQLFDLAFATRVGALDGRHPELEAAALNRIANALTKNGKLFIDGGNPLKEVFLDGYRHQTK